MKQRATARARKPSSFQDSHSESNKVPAVSLVYVYIYIYIYIYIYVYIYICIQVYIYIYIYTYIYIYVYEFVCVCVCVCVCGTTVMTFHRLVQWSAVLFYSSQRCSLAIWLYAKVLIGIDIDDTKQGWESPCGQLMEPAHVCHSRRQPYRTIHKRCWQDIVM